MIIYPAIDIIDGKCVRLEQGDFDRKKIYNDDPVEMAKSFEAIGASYLHVVDLDGTKSGGVRQSSIINRISKETNLKVQTGGGIRTLEQVTSLIDSGVDKVIIGSLSVNEIEKTKMIIEAVGFDRITLAFDVRLNEEFTPVVATLGWQKDSGRSLWEILDEYYCDLKMPEILCTDIDRDGLLQGPNFSLYSEILDRFPKTKLQASGGVRSVEDIVRLKSEGLFAVVTGKAIYEKRFTLDEVLKC